MGMVTTEQMFRTFCTTSFKVGHCVKIYIYIWGGVHARGCGHGDYFDLIRIQAEEQSQKVGQIGQGLDMIVRYVKQDFVEREQEMQGEQETEHQALDGRDWEQEVIDTEILDYLA